MEPEIIALARRMYEAFAAGWNAEIGARIGRIRGWNNQDDFDGYNRCWLRAALVARPELAEGVTVPAGHWAEGILQTEPTTVRVGEEPGGYMNGRKVER